MLSTSLHYGNIFEYVSLMSEVQFLKIQKKTWISKNLTNLDFTPETCQKYERNVDFTLQIEGNSSYTGELY